ncbi:MAG: S-formylglutathione hydrolase [Acidiferrobacterales bacterium]|nr:S-formylglutathione hydrolase [Acidiferrobacterales bacterium]
MKLETLSEQRCFGGLQGTYRHQSGETSTPMQFSVFSPPAAEKGAVPVLWYLSGLTCTEENFTVKAGAQRYAAHHNLMLIAPDTSPRGAGIEGEDDSYDFGSGAGFYVDATQAPWDRNYRMYSYITKELPGIVFENFAADSSRQGITGHSMGGHGALTIGLKNPETYQSISAFSPICAPMQCDWGKKALGGYLGDDQQKWAEHDASVLVESGHRSGEILVDQGGADDFLENQLLPERLKQACADAGQPLNLRMQSGYDHSYFFIASFVEDHVAFHAKRLQG